LAEQDQENKDAAIVKEIVAELAQQLPDHIEQSKKFIKSINNKTTNKQTKKQNKKTKKNKKPKKKKNLTRVDPSSAETKKDVLRSTAAMTNNLNQLRTHARPKPADKVGNLASKLDKQSNDLSKLPATGNKDQVTRAIRDIFCTSFA
jgi:hypothetical protein